MQQQEGRAGAVAAVFVVERGDALARAPQQRGVVRHARLGRVGEVAEQAKAQARVAVGQEGHLQPLAQLVDVGVAVEQAGHRHHGAGAGRNAAADELHRDPAAGHQRYRDPDAAG